MARFAYAVLWWLALPFIVLRLAWRSRKQPGYLEHLGERFGRYAPVADVPRIWIHAVSVGETRAAAPLIEALRARHPDHRILLTHMTPTGRATGVELFGDSVDRAWLPYDYGFATRRFFTHYRPRYGVILETELWPQLLASAARAKVPVKIGNARLSEQSSRGYARFASLTRWALANLAGIAAQSRADADRFIALGATAPVVTGNIKFDLEVPAAMRSLGERFRVLFGKTRRVIVAGSTRDGEEALLLDAFAAASPSAEVLLVIVPRHPQRFDEVAALATARGLAVARRSSDVAVPATTRVVIGDSMGEMLAYYGAADVVIMGGSLLDFGSQNLIEACAMGKPVVVGPSTYNFEDVSKSAIAAGAALRQRDANDALKSALALLADDAKRETMGQAAQDFANANRGALARLLAWL